jgi:hypothetical protein
VTGRELVHEVETDADGRCVWQGGPGAGGVVVLAEGHWPHHQALPQVSGEHRIVLPDGERVAGTLLVDGAPGAGWQLRIAGSPQLAGDLPRAVRDALENWWPEQVTSESGPSSSAVCPQAGKGRCFCRGRCCCCRSQVARSNSLVHASNSANAMQ